MNNLRFFQMTEVEIRKQMVGFPPESVESALRFQADGDFAHLEKIIVGAVALYRPKNCKEPLTEPPPEARLREDLGLDSLSLTEMAFMFDELFGIPVEIREVANIFTLGQLALFLRNKIEAEAKEKAPALSEPAPQFVQQDIPKAVEPTEVPSNLVP